MKWIEHKYVVVLNWNSEPYFWFDIEGVGMAWELILKDNYNLNYSQLLYLLFYIGRWLVIINCNVLLSSRVLGLLFAKCIYIYIYMYIKGLRYFMDYSLLANVYLEICFHNRSCNYKEPSSSMSHSPSIIWRLKVNKCCLFEKIIYF